MTEQRSIRDVLKSQIPRQVWVNMPRRDYLPISRLNPSSLVAGMMGPMEIDPRAIRDAFEKPDTPRAAASQDRMDRGTLAHLALLQPERLASDVAVWTGGTRRGAAWDGFEESSLGKLVIRDEDYQRTMAAVNQMRSQKLVSDLLCDIEPEVALFTVEGPPGAEMFCKGQVDAINRGKRVIVDVKTTEAGIDAHAVERTIRDMHYREKMALYREWTARETGTQPDDWACWNLFFGIGDHTGIRAVKFTTLALEWGLARMQAAMTATWRCLADDRWPMFAAEDFATVALWEMEEEGEVQIEYGT